MYNIEQEEQQQEEKTSGYDIPVYLFGMAVIIPIAILLSKYHDWSSAEEKKRKEEQEEEEEKKQEEEEEERKKKEEALIVKSQNGLTGMIIAGILILLGVFLVNTVYLAGRGALNVFQYGLGRLLWQIVLLPGRVAYAGTVVVNYGRVIVHTLLMAFIGFVIYSAGQRLYEIGLDKIQRVLFGAMIILIIGIGFFMIARYIGLIARALLFLVVLFFLFLFTDAIVYDTVGTFTTIGVVALLYGYFTGRLDENALKGMLLVFVLGLSSLILTRVQDETD